MGEGSRRHAKLMSSNPLCVYCGGVEPATTIDHMPPRVFFRLTQRPKGLEFPACKPCNRGTSKSDLVAALYGRCFPGIANEAEGKEWDRLLSEVKQWVPGVLEEMWVDPIHQAIARLTNRLSDEHAFLFSGGPITFAHMTAFAAKAGFALDYQERKAIVPINGRVQVRWFTSHEMLNDQLPPSLFELTGELKTLRQGKIDAGSDFQYAHGEFKEGVRLHYLRFRQSFSIAAFVVDNADYIPFPTSELATFSPGELKSHPMEKIRSPFTKEEWLRAGMPSRWN